eukprot:2812387-Amphidinium_carterae.1
MTRTSAAKYRPTFPQILFGHKRHCGQHLLWEPCFDWTLLKVLKPCSGRVGWGGIHHRLQNSRLPDNCHEQIPAMVFLGFSSRGLMRAQFKDDCQSAIASRTLLMRKRPPKSFLALSMDMPAFNGLFACTHAH